MSNKGENNDGDAKKIIFVIPEELVTFLSRVTQRYLGIVGVFQHDLILFAAESQPQIPKSFRTKQTQRTRASSSIEPQLPTLQCITHDSLWRRSQCQTR